MFRRLCSVFGIAAITCVLICGLAAPLSSAIDSQGVGAIPANPRPDNPRTKSIFVYTLSPGKTANDAIKVVNNTTSRKTISVYPVDSVPSSDGAFACAQAADPVKGVGSWIHLEQSSVTLAPFSSQVVPFTVTPSSGVDVGEHNGCIAIQENKSPTSTAKSGVTLSFRTALRVAVTVPGKLVANLQLVSVKQTAGTHGSYIVTPVYKNTGNISLDTTINTHYSNLFGQNAGQATGGRFPILRDSTGTFNFEIKKPFWGGLYKRVVTTSYKPLSTDIKDAPTPKSLAASESLVLLSPQPGGLLVELATLAVIAGAVGFWLNRRYTHQMMLRNSSTYTVKKGDNIQELAGRHNINWKQLARVNGLRAPYALQAGQKLHVPTKSSRKAETSD